jgi:BCD family chlorophyll transporter-like MFS transporter
MNLAPPEQRGLALGAWGAVQATSAGVAVALGGIIRDSVNYFAMRNSLGKSLADPSTGYVAVYLIEIILLLATIIAMAPLIKSKLPVRQLQTS